MIEIIPAIDLIDGKCVRLKQGDYDTKKVYNENPVEVAKQFEALGIEHLHLVDLDGAKRGKITNLAVLEAIVANTKLKVDFGGGVKTTEDVLSVLNAGANWVTVGSVAVKQPMVFEEWVNEFKADSFMLGADVKDGKVAVSGWFETSEKDVFAFLEEKKSLGIKNVFCTDVSKDGMLQGVAVDLYKELHARFPDIYLIASGGVSCEDDVYAAEKAGCSGVIIGKAIYEGKIDLAKLLKQ